MAPSTARGVPATKDVDNTTSNDGPTWDTSPNTFPQYYQELLVWLTKQESRYNLLVQHFVALDRGYTCCVSDNHSKRLDRGAAYQRQLQEPHAGQTQRPGNGASYHTTTSDADSRVAVRCRCTVGSTTNYFRNTRHSS